MEIWISRIVALLAVAMVVAIVARRLRLPYTVGLVLTGLGLALGHVDLGVALSREVIYDLLLPPLLFEAALNLHWRELRRDLAPVLAMATLGVVLCAAVVAAGLIYGLGWPPAPALAFGALVSATDPISVIALLREAGVKGRLALLIESESLLNDASAAALFGVVLAGLGAAAQPSLAGVLVEFLKVSAGGGAVGVACGLAAILFIGRTEDPLVETALTAVAAYGSFLIAEHFALSGVLASVSAGLVMGNLGVLAESAEGRPISERGRELVLAFWEFAAFLTNSFVFLMIGLALAGVRPNSLRDMAVVIALALLGRAAAVYPVALAFTGSRWRIPLAQQHFLWWAGLRGALALALALALPANLPRRDDILVAVFGIVAFSVIVQGVTAGVVLRALGLDRGDAPKRP